MSRNPGKRVTDYELCELFTPAYQRAASIEKAVNGFRCSGIFPLNPDVFDDTDFAPANVTEIPNPHEPTTSQAGHRSTRNDADIEPLMTANSKQRADSSEVNTSAAVHVTIQEISPLPRAAQSSLKNQKRKAETAVVLTSTPNKRALEEKQRELECSKPAARKKISFKQTPNHGLGDGKTARKQIAHKMVMKSAKASAKQASSPVPELQSPPQPLRVHSSEQSSAKRMDESMAVEVAEVSSSVISQTACEPDTTLSFYGHERKGRPDVTSLCDETAQIGSRSKRSHNLPSRFRK